jgi:hypothetical protein
MSNKKLLLKKLLEYPNLNHNEYISLINKKNKLIIDNNTISNQTEELNEINSKLDLYLEKELIINMIKCSHI